MEDQLEDQLEDRLCADGCLEVSQERGTAHGGRAWESGIPGREQPRCWSFMSHSCFYPVIFQTFLNGVLAVCLPHLGKGTGEGAAEESQGGFFLNLRGHAEVTQRGRKGTPLG